MIKKIDPEKLIIAFAVENDLEYISKKIEFLWKIQPDLAKKYARGYIRNNDQEACFCAKYNGKNIGLGLFGTENDDCFPKYSPWLSLLYVEPEFRGNDIGIALTKKRMEYARKLGYKFVFLDTINSSEYHRRLGWKDVGLVKYDGKDCSIMKFDLSKKFPKAS